MNHTARSEGAPIGVVLCGGSSSRMGRDKATIGNPPWAHRVAEALSEGGCEAVELQGGDPSLATTSWPHVNDSQPGTGPASAVTDALRRHRGATMVIAACDLPNLDAAHVLRLIESTRDPLRCSAFVVDDRAALSLLCIGSSLGETLGEPSVERANSSLRAMFQGHIDAVAPIEPLRVSDLDTQEDLRRRGAG